MMNYTFIKELKIFSEKMKLLDRNYLLEKCFENKERNTQLANIYRLLFIHYWVTKGNGNK
jgi:histone deacetylase complex regulatory component SIN3